MRQTTENWWATYQRTLRFVDGGRDGDQVDCYGFARRVYAEHLGITLDACHSLTLDTMTDDGDGFLKPAFNSHFVAVEMGFERCFDMAVIRRPLPVNGRIERGWWHLGIVSRQGHLVHIDYHQGVVEVPFRDTGFAREHATLRSKDVRLFRHRNSAIPLEAT